MSLTGNIEPLMFGRFVETGLHGFDVTIFTYKLRRLVCRRHPDSLVSGTRLTIMQPVTKRIKESRARYTIKLRR